MGRSEPLNTEEECPRHRKRANRKRKRFGIEYRYSFTSPVLKKLSGWHPLRWYHTEEQRDQALEMLIKHTPNIFKIRHYDRATQYRKVER